MPADAAGEGVCLGQVSPELRYRFIRPSHDPVELDERGWAAWEVPTGRVGELVVQGEHVCRGYWRNPDAFRRAKIRDTDGQVWHRTGDVAYEDPQGRLWMVGRVHSTICRDGEFHFPVKPEVLMKRLPFVLAAGYVGVPHPELGEEAVAAFSMRDGAEVSDSEAQVIACLRAAGVTVDRAVCLGELPLDPRHHSKVQYGELRRRLAKGERPHGD
jgi:acyl-CoA synthetase (AMP-forming)/AMP-acid ligase II